LFCLALLVRALDYWLTTAHELRRYYTNMWIWDPWDFLAHYNAYRHFDLAAFWIQHNEHRIIGTELLYALDMLLFRGQQILPEAAGIAAYLGVLLILVCCTWLYTEDKWPVACAACLAAAIAGYKICVVSLNIPFLACWPQVEFFSAAAFASLALRHTRLPRVFLAISFGIAATYTLASGVLSVALYFFHYHNLNTFTLLPALHHPGYFAMFLGSFLGMPFSAAFAGGPIIWTSVCGWVALALLLADGIWILWKRRYAEPAAIVLGGFCLMVLASALLTAVGRMEPSDPLIVASRAGRYITEPTTFWCALLLLTVWVIGAAWKRCAAFLFLLTTALLTFQILSQTTEYFQWWDNYFRRGQWASIGLANGLTDGSISDVLLPGRQFVTQFKHVLIENRFALFAGPEYNWIGSPASHLFSLGPDGAFHGEITTVRKIGCDFEVQGWADGANRVIFVSQSGQILGFAMRPAAGPAELYSNDVPPNLAFTGFIRSQFGAHRFSAWAVDPSGHRISRLGAPWTMLPP
jgi:hypothetical protein